MTGNGFVQRTASSCSGFGVFLGVFGAFAFSIGSLLVKVLNSNAKMDPYLISAVRQTFLLFLAGPQVSYSKASYLATTKDWPMLMARSICGGVSVTLGIVAISYLHLADAGAIIATSPVLTALLGRIFLKEKCYISDVPILLVTFGGVLLILRPPTIFQQGVEKGAMFDRLVGCSIAVTAAVFQAGMYLCIRKLRHVNFGTVSFFYSLVSGPVLFGIVIALGVFAMPPCYFDRTLMLLISAMAALGQTTQAIASRYVTAGVISLTRSTEIAFVFAWQLLFLDAAKMSVFSVCGCCLVTLAMTVLSLRSILVEKYSYIDSSKATTSKTMMNMNMNHQVDS